MSLALRRTVAGSLAGWGAGVLLITIAGALLFHPSPLGFAYFFVAALGAAVPSICWSYAAGKRLLETITPASGTRWVGPRMPIGRKIAVVFVGFFLVSSLALVLLVSSKVSQAIEELALSGAEETFTGVYALARTGGASPDQLRELASYVEGEFDIYRIDPGGVVTAAEGAQAEDLSDQEVAYMLRRKTGNSVALDSRHALRFEPLPDGAVIAVSVPWEQYRSLPFEIGLYALVITVLTLAIFGLAIYFLSQDIRRPLDRLATTAEAMARGDFRLAASVFSDDELGILGERFASTRSNLQRLIARVGSGGRVMADGVRGITGGSSELLRRSQEQAQLTENSSLSLGSAREGAEAILSAAEGVANRTEDASSRALELQASSEEVARSMDYLFQSVEKTSSSTTEMDAAAREMSGRTSFLIDIAEEVVSFVTQMDTTIEELRKRAQATAEISRQVRENAEVGGSAVTETVDGIRRTQDSTRRTADVLDELQKRVGQISQIVNVIEDITERTNLLSLNAAIIAAQAGEQGAGFSVVAGEIRELADRTRGSTKEIGAIIKAVQSGSREAVRSMKDGIAQVEDNVKLAHNASSSLEKILARANDSYDMANQISAALEEQASATRHLHEVTSRMNDHVAEINRSTQEQARGTKLLAEEAERVREIALQVRNSTDEQSTAGRGISAAMEQIAGDVRRIRDLLEVQLGDMAKIAEASQTMLMISQRNEALSRDFESSMRSLAGSSQEFESEVASFRVE
ncbi:MAG TPA: HAMP domain-containing methyl-accepting chemotaxis protein [Thermoanaerobaculia bacterium]|nr:HAMP domain-containing methyl-accepting chemotaxis protein [Thermoanaerobaculia bacterium]